jgi:hypothetical protein
MAPIKMNGAQFIYSTFLRRFFMKHEKVGCCPV